MFSTHRVVPVSREVIVFSYENLAAWREESKKLGEQVSEKEAEIKEADQKIRPIYPRYCQLERERKAWDAAIEAKSTTINASWACIVTASDDNPLSGAVAGYAAFNLPNEYHSLSSSRANKAATDAEFYPLEKIILSNQAIIQQAEAKIKSLERQKTAILTKIGKCENYLEKLENNPEHLFNDFEKIFITHLQQYEDDCPSQQSELARLALYNFREKITCIRNQESLPKDFQEEKIEEKEEESNRLLWQAKCAYLCGLTWLTLDKVNNKDPLDPILAQTLMNILQEMHISEDGKLPCRSYEGKNSTCKALFEELAPTSPLLGFISSEELSRIESQRYDAALKLTIETPPYAEVFSAMQRNIENLCRKHPQQEYFYTCILQDTHQLFNSIGNQDFIYRYNRYQKLINHAQGAPSCCDKLVGYMLIIAGLALGTLSVVAFFYGGWPLTAWFAKASLSLTASGVSLSGAASLLTGIYLTSRTGLSREMTIFANTANKTDTESKSIEENKITHPKHPPAALPRQP